MLGFKNFGIVGVGHIGGYILEELLKAKSSGIVDKVVVLTRPGSVERLQSYGSRGAILAPINDLNDVSAVTVALKDVDVIISALGGAASQLQIPIAEAATSAGVRLFVPSEFGGDTDGAKEGYPAMKLALANKIAGIVPVTKFFNGTFADFIWSAPMTNLDVKSGSVTVGGDGNAKLSFTSRVDVARFVVHVLTTLAPEDTVSKSFRIESQRLSFNEVFEAYRKKSGAKLEVKYIPIEELQGNLKKNPRDIASYFHLTWASGEAVVGGPSSLDNAKYPGWNPSPVIDYL
ncbi:unnamed protein product [Peniophora sp. CBMAI 1063]|nr:unnamed protein product [Peniophora sp. CBMAI 1063]